MADQRGYFPLVGEYGMITILGLTVLAVLATIILLMMVRKLPPPVEILIVFYGLKVRVRLGKVDDPKDISEELPSANIPMRERTLLGIIKKGVVDNRVASNAKRRNGAELRLSINM